MGRNQAFNQVSYHPRAKNIPHPDVIREHLASKHPEYAQKASDEDLVANYLIDRTAGGAEKMNPFPEGSNRHNAYLSYLNNFSDMVRSDPTYRPTTSASDLRAAAVNYTSDVVEDNECRSCRKVSDQLDFSGYCPNC